MADREGVLSKPEKETGLSDTRVTDDNELEEVIVASFGRACSVVVGVTPELSHISNINLLFKFQIMLI